jgi:hypothetical protein
MHEDEEASLPSSYHFCSVLRGHQVKNTSGRQAMLNEFSVDLPRFYLNVSGLENRDYGLGDPPH